MVSERVASEVRKIGTRASVRVLPVFISPARLASLPHISHPRFVKTILWVGRFEREKDPLTALAALRDVRTAGIDVGLIMLGSGSLETQLKRASEGLPVEFPGWQAPAPYLAMADVVLSTSPYESYGASIVEALGAGVPVVSRDVGIAKEAGAKVSEKEALASAVIAVLKSNERGVLKLPVLSAEEWAKRWKESLT